MRKGSCAVLADIIRRCTCVIHEHQMKNIKFASLLLSVLIIASLFCSCVMYRPYEIVKYAKELTKTCKYSLLDDEASALLDCDYTTKFQFDEAEEITVSSAKTICSVYLIWDRVPPEYTLTAGEDQLIECGKNGFLHEYITLPDVDTFTINVPEGTILCDIRVFSDGKAPAGVQVWQPPCEKADMLLLPAHADDELLFFGGALPYYAGQLGMNVQVAFFTSHWNEPVRPHEQLNGLWCVGVRNCPIVPDYPDIPVFSLDAAYKAYDKDEMLRYYVELLRRFNPEVVLGHDLNGEYGHGAHMLAARTLCDAVQISMNADYFPESAEEYGVWDVPKTYLHKYSENKVIMDWDKPLSAFGGKSTFEMAKAGFSCHRSQQSFSVSRTGYGSCTWFGLYRSNVGADTLADPDFAEHLEFSASVHAVRKPPTASRG